MAIKLTKKDIDWIQKKYPKLKRKSDILWQGEVNFNREFKISSDIFNNLVHYAETKGVKENKKKINQSKEKIKILLKAYIGRNLFDDEGFYPIYHKIDKGFQKAVEVLSDSNLR